MIENRGVQKARENRFARKLVFGFETPLVFVFVWLFLASVMLFML